MENANTEVGLARCAVRVAERSVTRRNEASHGYTYGLPRPRRSRGGDMAADVPTFEGILTMRSRQNKDNIRLVLSRDMPEAMV
jgi:hypothetical protein